MRRRLVIAGAQLGPNQRTDARQVIVARMLTLMQRASRLGVELIVFPELALTSYFPRWYEAHLADADHWYETCFPSATTQPLLDAARRYNMTLEIGFAELVNEADETGVVRQRRFNTALLVSPQGDVLLKYRKIHLPGHAEYIPGRTSQILEKRYFEVGNLGFPVRQVPVGGLPGVNVGMLICNDRRWPEAWRELGLQEVEVVMLGYNTPFACMDPNASYSPHLRILHSELSVQAGAYQNACFAVAVAKAGVEDGSELMGGTMIVNPLGEVIARASTQEDELIIADCDLDLCRVTRATTFDFAKHRRIETYQRLVSRVGSAPPEIWRKPPA